jgi:hypothetical protein
MNAKRLTLLYRAILFILISIGILTGSSDYAMIVLTFLWIFERPIEKALIKKLKIEGDLNDD